MPTQDDNRAFDKTLGETITSIAQREQSELFALTEAELAAQWWFQFDDTKTDVWNLYEFTNMLDLYKSRCRRWETHHNGSMCVVERVRDKYLIPRIREFLKEMDGRYDPRESTS